MAATADLGRRSVAGLDVGPWMGSVLGSVAFFIILIRFTDAGIVSTSVNKPLMEALDWRRIERPPW